MTRRLRIETLERPGRWMTDERLGALVASMREVAAACFVAIPEYQCLTGRRDDLDDKVITLARDARSGRVLGFCSAIVLSAEGVGSFLHLGLTCVDPSARGEGLTHRLTSRLVLSYFLRHHLLGRLWVTNVACVLSSLGNVALFFDEVHPSPFATTPPTPSHFAIARAIDARHRDAIYILPDATLDAPSFVFRGSVRGTVFQKEGSDARYWHRNVDVNRYYRELLRFDDGDEAVQVGYVTLRTLARYLAPGKRRTSPMALPVEVTT